MQVTPEHIEQAISSSGVDLETSVCFRASQRSRGHTCQRSVRTQLMPAALYRQPRQPHIHRLDWAKGRQAQSKANVIRRHSAGSARKRWRGVCVLGVTAAVLTVLHISNAIRWPCARCDWRGAAARVVSTPKRRASRHGWRTRRRQIHLQLPDCKCLFLHFFAYPEIASPLLHENPPKVVKTPLNCQTPPCLNHTTNSYNIPVFHPCACQGPARISPSFSSPPPVYRNTNRQFPPPHPPLARRPRPPRLPPSSLLQPLAPHACRANPQSAQTSSLGWGL